MWNTGIRIGEARTLTRNRSTLDGLRPLCSGAVGKDAGVVAGRQR